MKIIEGIKKKIQEIKEDRAKPNCYKSYKCKYKGYNVCLDCIHNRRNESGDYFNENPRYMSQLQSLSRHFHENPKSNILDNNPFKEQIIKDLVENGMIEDISM